MTWLLFACTKPPEVKPPVGPVVLLVSFDTTRADVISAYGRTDHVVTPTIDALAGQGTRFEWALAHAPTTLSSHASVFTGLDPHGHGVVANGYPLSQDLETLGERFEAAGWDTIAVVGASPLESRMQLGQGFRIYDDDVSTKVSKRYEDTADRVTDRALRALSKRQQGKPLFMFVHYFDPHAPWSSAPQQVRDRFIDPTYKGVADGSRDGLRTVVKGIREGKRDSAAETQLRRLYEADVAFADQELGRLLEGMTPDLVAFMGDHGEGLGEDSRVPYGHGYDVDLYATHVPLVLNGKDIPKAQVVNEPVRLMDLGTTLLAASGLSEPLGQGQDLRQHWLGTPQTLTSFAEATKGQGKSEGWNNLGYERMVVSDGALLIAAPWRRQPGVLMSLGWDPQPLDDPERFKALQQQLAEWDAKAPGASAHQMHPDTEAGLKALGYIE